ncbi:MAG: hypothetical protein HY698_10170 [Deltaproteobacteria bacterium]|nr:hypothetical protein [Deltaproteobacteria bacterium]
MTLIEIMVVLAIIALLGFAVSMGVGKVRKTELRSAAGRLATALRSAFDRASTTGAHHRVVIDLDEQVFRVERCEGKVRLRRSINEEKEEEQNEQAELAAPSPEGTVEAAVAAASQSLGHGSCASVKGDMGKPRQLPKKRSIGVSKVYVAHLEEPAEEGKVSVNFFPLGHAERAVIEVADDDDNVFSLVVHPLSGRVQIVPDKWQHPEEFVTHDAEGNEVKP